MKKILFIILSTVILFNCKNNEKVNETAQADLSTALPEAFEAKVDALVKQYQDLEIFSGIVLVAEKGKPIYHKAFGLADREQNRPNKLTTLFDIGSMNKTFTGIVIKQLIAEGKLNYDSKLTSFIKGFEDPNVDKVDIDHLLNHESGFGDYHRNGYFDLPKSEKTIAAITERAKQDELFFEPGEENEYSNTGYILLGAVIEKVTGKSYFENVKERIIEPINLQNTYVENLEKFDNQRASGYLYSPLGVLEKNENFQDVPNPDGGFLSTTEDVMKFYRSYYYDDILLTEAIKSEDSYFQQIRELPKGKAPLSAGGFEGFNTAMYHVLSDDRSIIVFANMDEPVAENLALGILMITRGQEPDEPKLPAIQNVNKAFKEKGVEYIEKSFEELTTNFHPEEPKDIILNDLGYAYIFGANDIDSAIKLFELNTKLFPSIANTWDSLGEAYYKKGDKKKALENYKKALEIRPDLASAKKMVYKIKI
tara:strand:+ start:29419 stop:30858 length:1440 start_codon:yes stop_codon:yes gene_type:complete